MKLAELFRTKVLTAVVMKSSIICDITPCSPLIVNRRFGGKFASIFRVQEYAKQETSKNMEATYSSDMSVDFERAARHYIPEDITLKLLVKAYETNKILPILEPTQIEAFLIL
jgi:hypothetical protein